MSLISHCFLQQRMRKNVAEGGGVDLVMIPLNNWFIPFGLTTQNIWAFVETKKNRQMKWGDIKLKTDSNGNKFLEWNERLTKTCSGQGTHQWHFLPKIFPNVSNPSRYHTRLYKKYASKRPDNCTGDDSDFYLTVSSMSSLVCQSSCWY